MKFHVNNFTDEMLQREAFTMAFLETEIHFILVYPIRKIWLPETGEFVDRQD